MITWLNYNHVPASLNLDLFLLIHRQRLRCNLRYHAALSDKLHGPVCEHHSTSAGQFDVLKNKAQAFAMPSPLRSTASCLSILCLPVAITATLIYQLVVHSDEISARNHPPRPCLQSAASIFSHLLSTIHKFECLFSNLVGNSWYSDIWQILAVAFAVSGRTIHELVSLFSQVIIQAWACAFGASHEVVGCCGSIVCDAAARASYGASHEVMGRFGSFVRYTTARAPVTAVCWDSCCWCTLLGGHLCDFQRDCAA